MGETEFCATKPILLCDPGAHVGTIFLLKPKVKVTMQGKQALFTNQVVEQATEDRILVTLTKGAPVVKYIVNYGVDNSICLTTQEHLQHAWGITLQCPGQLGYHTNTVHKYNLSMLVTQVPCSSSSTLEAGPKLPGLLAHIFAGYFFVLD